MGKGLIQVAIGHKLQVEPVANLRVPKGGDESGQRPGSYTKQGVKDQLQANTDIAIYLQGQVVQRMKNHIAFGERAAASTGRLVNATAHDRNRIVTKNFIGVGVPSYLKSSGIKYWRIFEEGTHGFVGTPLFGMGHAKFPNAHGDVPGLRTMKHARLAELAQKAQEAADNGEVLKPSGRMFVVQHEIKPANIYGQVAAENRGAFRGIAVAAAARILEDALKDIVVADTGFMPPGVK